MLSGSIVRAENKLSKDQWASVSVGGGENGQGGKHLEQGSQDPEVLGTPDMQSSTEGTGDVLIQKKRGDRFVLLGSQGQNQEDSTHSSALKNGGPCV